MRIYRHEWINAPSFSFSTSRFRSATGGRALRFDDLGAGVVPDSGDVSGAGVCVRDLVQISLMRVPPVECRKANDPHKCHFPRDSRGPGDGELKPTQ